MKKYEWKGKSCSKSSSDINIKDVVDEINKQTIIFKGLAVPVRIECDPETKQFEIFIENSLEQAPLMKATILQ